MTTERTLDKFFQCQRAEFTRKKTLYFWIKDCDDFRRSKLQNFLGLPTMVTNRIFSIYQLIARNLKWPPWDYLITMTAEIFFILLFTIIYSFASAIYFQNVISSNDLYTFWMTPSIPPVACNLMYGLFLNQKRRTFEYRIHWDINIWIKNSLEKDKWWCRMKQIFRGAVLIKNPIVQCQLCFVRRLLL